MPDHQSLIKRVEGDRRLRDALEDCHMYTAQIGPYWWRVASMEKLEALGLAEQYCPPSVAERPRVKARPYRLTNMGIMVLRALQSQEESHGQD